MKELIDIRLKHIKHVTDELKSSVENVFTSLIKKAYELEIWEDSITRIVVTDNLSEEVIKQANEWNIRTEITREKEYTAISKVLFNHNLDSPEHVIFIEFSILIIENFSLAEVLFNQIIVTGAKKLFPRKILDIQFTPQPRTLETYITVSAIEWIKAYYTSRTIKQIFSKTTAPNNHNSFLNAFKRSLKRGLYKYNSDRLSPEENLAIFWHDYNSNFHDFFLRISESETDNIELLLNDDCSELAYNVFDEIKRMTSGLIENGSFTVYGLKEKIKLFSSFFEVHLENETDTNFRIRLTKNPKDYFKDLIDTEPRFICFLDILGFSEFVNHYDNNATSTFLQDIQESFALAQQHLLGNKNKYNQEAIEHLEYQTFSDNISISIPYFDNENDFLSNFNILITYVRGLQMIMMSKGFFVRGGISIGSYYADNNIIFSGGLIKAYKLESEKAIYPRVLVDNEIINKLLNYNESQINYFGLKQAIILDWENRAFINPIGLMDSSLEQFNSIMSEIELDDDDHLSSLLSSLTLSVGEMTTNLIKTISSSEQDTRELIKGFINRYLQENLSNERIYTKYLWIKELFMWIENDGNEKLKFYYLSKLFEIDK